MSISLFSPSSGEESSSGRVPLRKDIPPQYKWDLAAIFPSDESWEESFRAASEGLALLSSFRGRLFQSPDNLLEYLRAEEKGSMEIGKLHAYAVMKSHEDTADPFYQAMADRAGALFSRFAAECSFFRPEILAAGEEALDPAMEENPELRVYRHFFRDIFRTGEHVLSPREEELLARSVEVARTAENVFSLLTNADMTFPVIRDENGREVELSEERYYRLSRSRDRRVRKESFEGLYSSYGKLRNSFAALYSGSVKSDMFYGTARKYPSSLHASLHPDNIPAEVYDTVIRTVNGNLDALHEYMSLRRKALGIEELHMYDLNVPLVPEPEVRISYDKAAEMVKEGLSSLGDEYLRVLEKGFSSGWVDVFENQGKRKGAYSWGSYGTHPYVLLNYNGTLRDVFTIAHEMGHSLHTWHSHGSQPQVYADYTIFLAEVASTTNESLLLESLLDKASREERIFLLNHFLDQVRTTVFRQAMFAEFERESHARAEKGESLTADLLCRLWRDLNIRYHGPEMTVDPDLEMEWARIPHFYSAFYVYKYVTGFAAATSLSRRLRRDGKEARDSYLRFLSRGSSAYSLDILREAGVDMTTSAPLEETVRDFREKTWLLRGLLSL